MKTILRKDKRALSPVIAVVLMVAVAVAAAVLAYIWSVGLQSGTQAKVRDTVDTKINKNKQIAIESQIANSDLVADAVDVSVSIRNIGGSIINSGAYSLYVDGQYCSDTDTEDALGDGNRTTIIFTDALLAACDVSGSSTSHKFKVTGPEGVVGEEYTLVA
ncbi:MAG: hypothetical protein J7K00_01135 [Candidatus Diapherotrites archaeon]|nr:hypothetical protein [Candidatus Diapherotrites archaeon]